ncbi:MAG TPA: CBS domain-containing protein [Streptosporangiaceae bacterium]|nr:CBS domain-containing protein [Streptosporangiaceae bacterium]
MEALVKDVMTTQVMRVKQDTPFAAIAAALRQYRVSAFPVLGEDGRVIGVVSESDLLDKLALGGDDHMPGMAGILRHKDLEKARGITAADLMTAPPVTVAPDDTVEHAARLMYLRGVKRLPVIDADGQLAGIVSRTDVLAVYDRPDVEIAEDIRTSVLSTEEPATPGAFDVAVAEGVVTLTGRPQTREQGHQIVFRARHIEGVVAVRDRFDYPAPGPDAFDVLARFPAD